MINSENIYPRCHFQDARDERGRTSLLADLLAPSGHPTRTNKAFWATSSLFKGAIKVFQRLAATFGFIRQVNFIL